MSSFRIGHGFDVHKLVTGRDLILGGVKIAHEKGLEGHSDADVVLHAVADALLGAASLPDIGSHFPPSDEKYKNADSYLLLRSVVELLREAGYKSVINVDITLMAERPKIATYTQAMRKRIASALEVDISQVGLKATTTERLGFVGREEGIAASAVVLISTDA